MKLEQLFEYFKDELKEIYEEYELNKYTIQMIENAVMECFDSEEIVDPADFIGIVAHISSSTYEADTNNNDVNLDYKDILQRAKHAKHTYEYHDPESLNDDYDYSDGNHRYI